MKCPSCNRKVDIKDLLIIAFSRGYTCPNCQTRSVKSSNIEWGIYGAVLAVGWVANRFLGSSVGFWISVLLGVSLALALEYFFQELTPQ